jgi:hypothetical protein
LQLHRFFINLFEAPGNRLQWSAFGGTITSVPESDKVRAARLGGIARARKLTPEQLSELSAIAGIARQASMTPAQRSAAGRAAVQARWKKAKGAKKAKESAA